MANTYVAIATVTVGSGGAANITFTSIPQTYTDLLVKWSARSAADTGDQNLRFNGDTGSVYSMRLVRAFDSNQTGSEGNSSQTSDTRAGYNPKSSYTASTFGNGELYIPNYTSANYKSFSIDSVTENNSSAAYLMQLHAGLWANTAAITSMTFTPETGNFAQYSTATLYGIKNS